MTETRFEKAKSQMSAMIAKSSTEEDPSHAENTLQWVLMFKPDADEILQLAAFSHDIERAMSDRLVPDMFDDYDSYKLAHSTRAGKISAKIAQEAGYADEECKRLASIIKQAEFSSNDPDIQLICDADSVSYFDNNAQYYLAKRGEEATEQKMRFMYTRASERAQAAIQEVLALKPHLNLLCL